jgi:short-subunit dehydrogenase
MSLTQSSASRVVAITGASSGIGRTVAQKFARDGWRVGLISRSTDTLDAVRRDVVTLGGTACVAAADVADSGALEAAAAHIEQALGPIDVWINNAGVSVYGKFLDITEEEFRRTTETNYYGTVNGTRVALRRMIPRNRGTVVQVLSAISYRGVPLQSAYSGSKYALRGFTEAIRSELIGEGSRVHVTMIHPPAVNTPFYNHAQSHLPKPVRPPPPVYQPEIVADAVYLAATTRRREVQVTSSTVGLTIVNKAVPSLLDYALGKVGLAAQQTDKGGAAAKRDSNLFKAASEAGATHGAFDSEARSTSAQMWLTEHRGATLAGLGLIALAALAGGTRQA